MSVVTISRQMGCLGTEIAHLVAEQLGYRLVWRELINEAAIRSGTPEVALAAIDELGLLGICPSPRACRKYRKAVETIVSELAEKGEIVIIGRAAQVILRNHKDAFHVRLIAPKDIRIARVSHGLNISEEAARAQVETSDRFRKSYLRKFYQVDWNDPALYHITLNTGYLLPEQAAQIICLSLRSFLNAPVPIMPVGKYA